MKKIRIFGDPVLREKSSSVKKIDSKIANLIEDLKDTKLIIRVTDSSALDAPTYDYYKNVLKETVDVFDEYIEEGILPYC